MRTWDTLLLLAGESDSDCGPLLITGTGKAMRTSEMMIENWTESSTSSSHIASTYPTKFVVNFRVKKEFGEPGALFVKNFHRNEFLLKEITVEVPNRSSLHFICDSCVYNVDHYAADRAFFTNKVTPPPPHGYPR